MPSLKLYELYLLQDRRRPLWPAFVAAVPSVVGMAVCIANRSYALVPMLQVYLLLIGIGLIAYMVRAHRQCAPLSRRRQRGRICQEAYRRRLRRLMGDVSTAKHPWSLQIGAEHLCYETMRKLRLGDGPEGHGE